jgi:hypothetical protein
MSFDIPKLIIILNQFYDKNASIAMDVINERVLWDLYAGIAMNVKNERLLWDLHAGIAMNVKNQRLTWDLYVSIAYLKMASWNLEYKMM